MKYRLTESALKGLSKLEVEASNKEEFVGGYHRIFSIHDFEEVKEEADNSELMTFDEVKDFLKISKATLYSYTSKDKIPFYKPFGRKLYFKRSEINNFIQNSLEGVNK